MQVFVTGPLKVFSNNQLNEKEEEEKKVDLSLEISLFC